jgi:hypothetical protein
MTKQNETSKPSKTPNPTGKGGFADNPQNIGSGHWSKEDSIPYQYNFLMRMTTDELSQWARDNQKKMTVAQAIALNRIQASLTSLPDAKEITDRTSGRAKETIEHTIVEAPVPLEDLRKK